MANIGARLFSKELSDTDVVHRLHWPAEQVHLLPPFGLNHQVDFPVKDREGNHFNFRCSKRRNGHPKHVVSSGWKSFLQSKGGLNPSDQVIFYEDVGHGDARFVVSVKRRVPLFGVNINDNEE